jgi:hypothetical protein
MRKYKKNFNTKRKPEKKFIFDLFEISLSPRRRKGAKQAKRNLCVSFSVLAPLRFKKEFNL